MSSSSSSPKAVYTAVLLLPPAVSRPNNTEQQLNQPLLIKKNSGSDGKEQDKNSIVSTTLHFVAGAAMGMFCYYAVNSLVLPRIPRMLNAFADSAFSAFIWSAITTVVAYVWWFGFIFVFRACCKRSHSTHDDNNEDEEVIDASFWEEMEYYYALGVFLGFSSACIVTLALAGVPSIFLMLVILSAFIWTRVMAWVGRKELYERSSRKKRTVLPMMIV